MKPATLNQLLFHPKSACLSLYWRSVGASKDVQELTECLSELLTQLKDQDDHALADVLEMNLSKMVSIVKSHPDKGHAFYLASDFQGYIILDYSIESYHTIGESFHVRPLIEELLVNPEYMVVNVSLYDIKIYQGDFQHLEIVQQFEFADLPKSFFGENHARLYAPQYLGLIPYKTIMALKTIAQKVMDMVIYRSIPIIVTGLDEIKNIFLRYFEHSFGVISHVSEDFYEKTCVEILERCKNFRYMVMDFYSAQFKERLKKLVKTKRLIADLSDIIKAVYEGRVVHLILPTEKRLWGRFDSQSGEFSLDNKMNKKTSVDILNDLAEEVMRQGGRIQVLGPHFFPTEAHAMAVLRG